ncbi:pentapeptide repeat-containing protein [Streptomyces sp. NPDC059445]|uniref:pentapeptide repeat-containing protein n=1 Tax=Streptomyces sp. NPDC059445 TaxID=3346832 RepID=UPI0036CA56FE
MSDFEPRAKVSARMLFWGGLVTAALVAALIWAPWWIEGHHLRDKKGNLVSSAGLIITGFRTMLIAIVAGVFTAAGLWYTHRSHQQTEKMLRHTEEKDQQQANLIREGQVTDRYVEAIKLLSSDSDIQRLGGIYSLERIMRDSTKDRDTVISVLSAFVRQHAPRHPTRTSERPDEVVQAALTVLGRRPSDAGREFLDLQQTDLSQLSLTGGRYRGARFDQTDFTRANLASADFQSAVLHGSTFDGADLTHAVLWGASLEGADFTNALAEDAIISVTQNLPGVKGTPKRHPATPLGRYLPPVND